VSIRSLLRSPAWDSVTYWALDLETGGLDVRKDPILAVGMVPVRAAIVRLGEAYRTLVRPAEGGAIDPASVRAHQLLWGDVSEAPPLAKVLPEVDERIRQGVLLVHQKSIDVGFLRRDYRRLGMRWPGPPVVDTVDLLVQTSRLGRPDLPRDLISVNLSRARRARGLPEYQAHDALTDAIATAELFLALRMSLGARTVRDLR
jgi:DNA polymerase-3 subunit epsilon